MSFCWVDPPSFLKEPHRGIEPWCGSLTLFVTGGPCRLMAAGAEGAAGAVGATTAAAFGVFCWLKVSGFDFALFFIFFCFVLHTTF
jgi:hypothetical protein